LDLLERHEEAEPFYALADLHDPNGSITAANLGWHHMQVRNFTAAEFAPALPDPRIQGQPVATACLPWWKRIIRQCRRSALSAGSSAGRWRRLPNLPYRWFPNRRRPKGGALGFGRLADQEIGDTAGWEIQCH